jgi:hypothetical protein
MSVLCNNISELVVRAATEMDTSSLPVTIEMRPVG